MEKLESFFGEDTSDKHVHRGVRQLMHVMIMRFYLLKIANGIVMDLRKKDCR